MSNRDRDTTGTTSGPGTLGRRPRRELNDLPPGTLDRTLGIEGIARRGKSLPPKPRTSLTD